MKTDCAGCYFEQMCCHVGACDDYYDMNGLTEEDLIDLIERGRSAYYEEFAAYLKTME